jgi:hypothetical protein
MARSLQKELTPDNQDPSPTPAQPLQQDPVSLVGPPAKVEQWGPTPDIVIDVVEPAAAMAPDREPVVTFGDDGSITIN